MRKSLSKSILLIVTLLVVLLPLVVVLVSSFMTSSAQDVSAVSLNWYTEAFTNKRFTEALQHSSLLALLTSICATPLAFFLAIFYWESKKRIIILLFILLWGIIPPEVQAIAFSSIVNLGEVFALDWVVHIVSITLGVLPYCALLMIATLNTFDPNVILAAQDLGATNSVAIRKIVLPLALPGLISCLVLAFLLGLNEYAKTYYLSGSTEYISELMIGKLRSGADPTIYAAGGLNILLALVFIAIFKISQRFLHS